MVEKQRNQDPSDTAIAVLKGMEQFKLGMNHCCLQEQVNIIACHVVLSGFQMVLKL